ncbi:MULTISPECIES: DUF1667 domain-containing protein [Atopobiaceae]|uniref:CxxC motif-containing protein n=1 Tax=Parafannyhessea umbonata TaxID=604330 RepID=A0A1H6JEV5_9ACTN|nr:MULTISPECIES: DUF1667 domain-containing protein [Atopobiaceae]SEH60785.1 CxxC motif-containing protein [Parafannyhessea umbonata]SJZ80838.1 CxxC motif-containing protein [Olsenella sp. KH1P3]
MTDRATSTGIMRELTCIRCPRGCHLVARLSGTEVASVGGNACPRGDAYARKELTNPTRVVTSTVRVAGRTPAPMLPVKTAQDVPKDLVRDVMEALASVRVSPPVRMGQVVLADVCGTGVDVVATASYP